MCLGSEYGGMDSWPELNRSVARAVGICNRLDELWCITDQEIVWLNVPVQEAAAVDVLNPA